MTGFGSQKRTAKRGKLEKDSQNRTGRQNKTAMTGLSGKDPGLLAQDCKDKTARAEQKGEDSQKRTGMQGS